MAGPYGSAFRKGYTSNADAEATAYTGKRQAEAIGQVGNGIARGLERLQDQNIDREKTGAAQAEAKRKEDAAEAARMIEAGYSEAEIAAATQGPTGIGRTASLVTGRDRVAKSKADAEAAKIKQDQDFRAEQARLDREAKARVQPPPKAPTYGPKNIFVDGKEYQGQFDEQMNPKPGTKLELVPAKTDPKAVDVTTAITEAERGLATIDKMLKHPGLKDAVGFKGAAYGFGALSTPIAGTDAADFMSYHNQLQGQAFLEAFGSLKGSGQITEVEGRKATQALSRMDPSLGEEEFRRAAAEFQQVIRDGLARAKRQASRQPQNFTPAQAEAPRKFNIVSVEP
jgi:hypothetical protein